jgi:hypothetical protein
MRLEAVGRHLGIKEIGSNLWDEHRDEQAK